MIELICQKEQSLKQFTDENCIAASFCLPQLLKNKDVKVNGAKVGADVRLCVGDTVRYYMTEKQANATGFTCVYEDENVLIVDKDSGVNSEAVFAELYRKKGGRVAFIHRLDRNTRGLMVFAYGQRAEEELLCAFRERRVEKRYHALCFGTLCKDADVLTAYLKKDETSATVRIFDEPVARSERIVTEYKVLERYADTVKVEITLHTGKTHQIRAHMSHVSCPVVGDMKYGDARKNRDLHCTRQRLVAKSLRFSLNGALQYLNETTFTSQYNVED